MIVVDSYFKWLEVVSVSSLTSCVVVKALCRLFITHRLPNTIVAVNGAQFTFVHWTDPTGHFSSPFSFSIESPVSADGQDNKGCIQADFFRVTETVALQVFS